MFCCTLTADDRKENRIHSLNINEKKQQQKTDSNHQGLFDVYTPLVFVRGGQNQEKTPAHCGTTLGSSVIQQCFTPHMLTS